MNDRADTAVNDACLVFDHRLVVDLDHNTNDPNILAAGPLTKFSRGLYADNWSEQVYMFVVHVKMKVSPHVFISFRTHEQFNSQEVGRKVC